MFQWLNWFGLTNAPINSKVQHPPPPRAFELVKIGLFKFRPLRASRSNAPPISTELPLLKDKFGLQSSFKDPFQRVIH